MKLSSGPGLPRVGADPKDTTMKLRIHDLAEIRTGYQSREGLQTSSDGTCFAIQAKDIDDKDHSLIGGNLEKTVLARDFSPYVVHDGDLVFLARGRKHFASVVEKLPSGLPTIALYYFFILRIRAENVQPAFLAWLINEVEAQEYLDRMVSTTAGIPFITKQSFGSLEVRLPPLEVQAEIVHLHRLGCEESRLLRQLESKRSERVRSICRVLYDRSDF